MADLRDFLPILGLEGWWHNHCLMPSDSIVNYRRDERNAKKREPFHQETSPLRQNGSKAQAACQAALESGRTGMDVSMPNPLPQAQPDRTDHQL